MTIRTRPCLEILEPRIALIADPPPLLALIPPMPPPREGIGDGIIRRPLAASPEGVGGRVPDPLPVVRRPFVLAGILPPRAVPAMLIDAPPRVADPAMPAREDASDPDTAAADAVFAALPARPLPPPSPLGPRPLFADPLFLAGKEGPAPLTPAPLPVLIGGAGPATVPAPLRYSELGLHPETTPFPDDPQRHLHSPPVAPTGKRSEEHRLPEGTDDLDFPLGKDIPPTLLRIAAPILLEDDDADLFRRLAEGAPAPSAPAWEEPAPTGSDRPAPPERHEGPLALACAAVVLALLRQTRKEER